MVMPINYSYKWYEGFIFAVGGTPKSAAWLSGAWFYRYTLINETVVKPFIN